MPDDTRSVADQQLAELAKIEIGLEITAAEQRGEPLDAAAIAALLARWGGNAGEMEAMLARHRGNAAIERASAELQANLHDSIALGLDPAPAWNLFGARMEAVTIHTTIDTPAEAVALAEAVGEYLSRPIAAAHDLSHVPPHPFVQGARGQVGPVAGGSGTGAAPVVNPCPYCGVGMTSAGCGCTASKLGYKPGGFVPAGWLATLPGSTLASVATSGDFELLFGETEDAKHDSETLAVGGVPHTPILAVMAVAAWLSEAAANGWTLDVDDVVGDDGPLDVKRELQNLADAVARFQCYGKVGR